jgi:UDP-N-acetylmuramate--alanine ligase
MKTTDIHRVYFLGIGGIGMSALARYFKSIRKEVAGYDRVSTHLTQQLEKEGMVIFYKDEVSLIPEIYKKIRNTLIVYTPAVPSSNSVFEYFRHKGYEIMKRSQVLGKIMELHTGIAVAGTHGKTTISSMIAHIFKHSGKSCNAFLGGIAKNFNSNLVLDSSSDYFIAEADEFDRSFLTLFPDYAVVSSADDDHLDIYGERKNLVASFNQFISQVKPTGVLVIKQGVDLSIPAGINLYRYALTDPCDYYAFDLFQKEMHYRFSIHTPEGEFTNINLGVNGKLNVENAVAAWAIAQQAGIDETAIKDALENYNGVLRRFDVKIRNKNILFIDDYAHHPEELRAFISSVREMVPDRKITGIFQPHLYSRTRDFASGFAKSLSLLDNVIMLEIYAARELPVEGVNSGLIFNELTNKGERIYCSKEQILNVLGEMKPEVLLTMGAGDIDQIVEPIKEFLLV